MEYINTTMGWSSSAVVGAAGVPAVSRAGPAGHLQGWLLWLVAGGWGAGVAGVAGGWRPVCCCVPEPVCRGQSVSGCGTVQQLQLSPAR